MLLDTHALVWYSTGAREFGRKTTHKLKAANSLYFSSISIFEIEIKRLSGRWKISPDYLNVFRKGGLLEISFSAEDVSALEQVGMLQGHDPFDRAMLAQALSRHLPFVTADEKIIELGLPLVIDARA